MASFTARNMHNIKFIATFRKHPQTDAILLQFYPVHTIRTYFFQTHTTKERRNLYISNACLWLYGRNATTGACDHCWGVSQLDSATVFNLFSRVLFPCEYQRVGSNRKPNRQPTCLVRRNYEGKGKGHPMTHARRGVTEVCFQPTRKSALHGDRYL